MKTSLNALHHQAGDWLRELNFYNEETALLSRRLADIAYANTGQEIAAQVEHFQNRFILLKEQMNELQHDVANVNNLVTEISKQRPEHINERYISAGTPLQNKMNDFLKSFASVRFEFNQFLCRTM